MAMKLVSAGTAAAVGVGYELFLEKYAMAPNIPESSFFPAESIKRQQYGWLALAAMVALPLLKENDLTTGMSSGAAALLGQTVGLWQFPRKTVPPIL